MSVISWLLSTRRFIGDVSSIFTNMPHYLQCYGLASHIVLWKLLSVHHVGEAKGWPSAPTVVALKPGNYLASAAPAEINLHQRSQPFTWRGSTFPSLTLTPLEWVANVQYMHTLCIHNVPFVQNFVTVFVSRNTKRKFYTEDRSCGRYLFDPSYSYSRGIIWVVRS